MSEAMTREDWNALDQTERRKFIAAGGKLTDPPPPAGPKISDPNVMTRGEFDAFRPVDQRAIVRSGRRIVDGERVPPEQNPGFST